MKNRPNAFLLAAALLGPSLASAQQPPAPWADAKAVNTGGPNGAYHTAFCPQVPPALSKIDMPGYRCVPSGGSAENIARVLQQPANVGFAQFDVMARFLQENPAAAPKLSVVRSDIGCEALVMVSRNPAATFGDVQGRARRLTFVTPPANSGAAVSFDFLRSLDPEGLGRARNDNVVRVAGALDVVNRVATAAADEPVVGFFVQFLDPSNAVVKRLVETGLTVVPVVGRDILRAEVDGKRVYEVRDFRLSEGGFLGLGGRAVTVRAACTPMVLFTGSPEAFPDRDGKDDARDRVAKLAGMKPEDFLPATGGLRSLWAGATRLSQSAVDQLAAGAESVRKSVTE